MTSTRFNPIRAAGKAVLLVGLGVAAFYALEVADRLLSGGAPLPPAAPTALAETPAARGGEQGNPWLARALVRIAQHRSVACEVVQAGWIDGALVETHGVYRQVGAGADRRFSMRLQGRLGDEAARLTRISDGRFLWTDLRWGEAADEHDRQLTRVDLRRLRREIAETESPEPGRAVVELASPGEAVRLGGLPMLLGSLNEAFAFGSPREMRLRGERVVAMVGRWRSELRTRWEGDAAGRFRRRAPDHVVVALSKATLLPLLVEYRSVDDPLAAEGLADEALLRPSARPMLKLDFLRAVTDIAIPETEFAFSAPTDAPLRDETDRELRIAQARREQTRVAATSGDAPR